MVMFYQRVIDQLKGCTTYEEHETAMDYADTVVAKLEKSISTLDADNALDAANAISQIKSAQVSEGFKWHV